MRDIYLALHCPAPFQLLYSWDVAALPATVQPVSAPLAHALASQQPLAGVPQLAAALAAPVAQHTSFMQLLTNSLGEAPPVAAVPAAQPGQEHAPAAVFYSNMLPAPANIAADKTKATAAKKQQTAKATRAKKKPARGTAAAKKLAAAAAAAGASAGPGSDAAALTDGMSAGQGCTAAAAPEAPPSAGLKARGLLALLQPSAAPQASGESAAAASSKGQRASKGSGGGAKRGKKAAMAGQAKQPAQQQQALAGQVRYHLSFYLSRCKAFHVM